MLVTNRDRKLHVQLSKAFDASKEIVLASAYVSPGACELVRLLHRTEKSVVKVALGRACQDGLSNKAKEYLVRLHRAASRNGGGVRVDPTGWHSKLYATSEIGFIGSSNLTEHGLAGWTEANLIVNGAEATLVFTEANRLYEGGVPIDQIVDEIQESEVRRSSVGKIGDSIVFIPTEPAQATPGIEISLLSKGDVPPKSGLNWGWAKPRPNEDQRNRYSAYIRFPNTIIDQAKYVFGSVAPGTKFLAYTHDGKILNLMLEGSASYRGDTVAKQISTTGDKSALGRWMIVDCLGITDVRPVTLADLQRYGRTTVEFYRMDISKDGLPMVYIDFSRRR